MVLLLDQAGIKCANAWTVSWGRSNFWGKYWWNLQLKHRENRKTLPREHLIGCQGVKMFLLKDYFKVFVFTNWDLSYFKFCHNLSFWVLSLFQFSSSVTILVLSHWFFLIFSSQFDFCHNLILSQFDFSHNLTIVTICVLSQFEFCHKSSFVTIQLCHNLSFRFLSQIFFFEFCHHLCFWVSSQFEF